MESGRSFTNADDARLISLIRSAKTRLVFAAPGVSKSVGKALAEIVDSLLAPKQLVVILDIDPEVCRLGYRDKINKLIDTEIAEVRGKLVDDLTPGLVQKPPKSWLDHTIDGKLDEKRIRKLLGEGIDRALAQIRKDFSPVVTLVFKDVTYTTIIHDPEFREKLEAHFGVEDVKRLFREWDSARGDDPGAALVKR